MVEFVQPSREVYVGGHVVMDKLEVRIILEVGNVLQGTGSQVVHADDPVAFEKESLAEMTPYKPRPSRDKRVFFRHSTVLLAPPEAPVEEPGLPDLSGLVDVASVHEELG